MAKELKINLSTGTAGLESADIPMEISQRAKTLLTPEMYRVQQRAV